MLGEFGTQLAGEVQTVDRAAQRRRFSADRIDQVGDAFAGRHLAAQGVGEHHHAGTDRAIDREPAGAGENQIAPMREVLPRCLVVVVTDIGRNAAWSHGESAGRGNAVAQASDHAVEHRVDIDAKVG